MISKHKMIIKPLYVEQGVKVPWIYGYSYYDVQRDEIVAYIIPLNIVVVFGLYISALFRYRIAKWIAKQYDALLPKQ